MIFLSYISLSMVIKVAIEFQFVLRHKYSLSKGFSGKDNQFRELLIKTGMAVGGDN